MPSKRPPRPPLNEPTVSAAPDHAATTRAPTRPKFHRRPVVEPPLESPAPSDQPVAEPSPHRVAWYEDLRFGAALMLLLLLLNLALIYAIPMMAAPANDANREMAISPNDVGGTNPGNGSSITVYAHPELRGNGAPGDASENHAPAIIAPPASATNIPPPSAPPLDRSKSMEENMNQGDDQ